MKQKGFTVYFHGKTYVEAENESEARSEAYDILNEVGRFEFSTDEVEED